MLNFSPLAARSGPVVWDIPDNFNGFRVFAALLHGSQVVIESQPNSAALNTGRHLCSAGRPSGWALAHILVSFCFPRLYIFVLWFLLLLVVLSWPNLSGRRLDVCHTSTHGVPLVL